MLLSEDRLAKPIDNVVLQFRPNPAQAPWAAAAGKDEPKSAIHKAFTPETSGHEDYERQVPALWDTGSNDDLLVKSLIENYALEGRGDGGAPTGKFYLDQAQLYKAGEEVVRTHLSGLSPAGRKAYLDEHVPRIFKHMDITNQGYILATQGPQALRLLVGEVEVQNGLQVQLDEDVGKAWRPNPILSPFAAKPEAPPPPTKITGGFAADYNEHHLNYDREVPDKYSGDLLMKSIISKWAIEGKNADGSKNGKFFMTKDKTEEVCKEVVETHLHMTGAERDSYVAERLGKL